jgi:hypothetical protein
MEQHGRLVRTTSGWKCSSSSCPFEWHNPQEAVAQALHESFVRDRLSRQQTTSGTGSVAGSGHLESDDATAASLPFRYAEAPYSRGASSVAGLWPAQRLSIDVAATETLQGRASASRQHPYSFPQPPGKSNHTIHSLLIVFLG